MWQLGVLGGLFIFDTLLVFMYVKFIKTIVESYRWVNEKQLELLALEEANSFVNDIEEKLQLFASWMTQTKNIIIPGILGVQLISAHIIGGLMDQVHPTQLMVNLVAWGQAGVIVSLVIMVQRSNESFKILTKVNEEYIKLTVLKEADEIEHRENHLDGE